MPRIAARLVRSYSPPADACNELIVAVVRNRRAASLFGPRSILGRILLVSGIRLLLHRVWLASKGSWLERRVGCRVIDSFYRLPRMLRVTTIVSVVGLYSAYLIRVRLRPTCNPRRPSYPFLVCRSGCQPLASSRCAGCWSTTAGCTKRRADMASRGPHPTSSFATASTSARCSSSLAATRVI